MDDLPFPQDNPAAMSWIPHTPAKPIPRKPRSGPSAHRGREYDDLRRNQTSRGGLLDYLQPQPQPQAALNSMDQWAANAPYCTLLAAADATAASKMTAFTPLMMSQIRKGQAMAAAHNPLLLNGNNLLPQTPIMAGSSHNPYPCQTSPYDPLPLDLNSLPEKTAPGVSCSPSNPIADLAAIAETGGNIQGKEVPVHQTMADANDPARLFCPNPITSPQFASSQLEEGGVGLDIPAGATEEHQHIDPNKLPQAKPKRKKHRPKVVREGKSSRTPKPATPKPVTPKPARKDERPSGKRKYVRKNKASNFADAPCQSTHVVDQPSGSGTTHVVDRASGSGTKTARRCLNFDSEETQPKNECQGLSVVFERNSEGHAKDRFIPDSGTSSAAQTTVPQEMLPEGSQTRTMLDLNSSANQIHDEPIRPPKTPIPPYRPSRREIMRVNNMAGGFIRVAKLPTSSPKSSRRVILVENLKKLTKESEVLDNAGSFWKLNEADQGKSVPSGNASLVLLSGVKRHHSSVNGSLITRNINFIHASNPTDSGHNFSSPESRKKMRADGGQNEQVGSSSSFTLTSLNRWKMGLLVPRNCRMLTVADAQRLVAFKKQQASCGILPLEQGEKKAKNGPELVIEGGGSTSSVEAGKSTSPSINQVSSNECSNSQDIQTCESRDNHVKIKTKRHSKKECSQENVTQSCGCIMYGHQISDKVTVSASNISYASSNNQVSLQKYKARQSSIGSHPRTSMSGVIVPSWEDLLDQIVQMMRCLHISGEAQNTLVPYGGGSGVVVPYNLTKKRRPRPKVDLDSESERVWKLLMGKEADYEGPNEDKEKWWEKERQIFTGRVTSFVARMHLVLGDRRFSQWKGSVVDSVVGVFLTQNVSDHLSSSAFMSLAARFPLRSKGDNDNSNEELGIPKEHAQCNVPFDVSAKWKDNMLGQELNDQGSFGKAEHMTEVANSNSSPGSNTGSSTVDCLNFRSLDVHETEVEICQEQPDSTTSAPVTVTGSTSVTEVDDRSMEDVVSSQNSVVSPQDHLDHTAQLADKNKLNLLSKFDADDLLYGCMSSGLDSSTSFMELLHMAETTRFKELYNHENGRIVSTEYCGEVDQLASLEVSKNASISDIPNYADGECPSVHELNSHPCNASNDFMSVSYTPFWLHNPLNADTITKNTFSGLHLKASGMETTNNIDTTCIRSGLLAENSSDAMDQCLPSSLYRKRPVVDTHTPINKHCGQSSTCLESEVYIDKHSSCHGNHTKKNNEILLDSHTLNKSSILQDEQTAEFQQREREVDFQVESTEHAVGAQSETQDCRVHQSYLNSESKLMVTPEAVEAVESNLKVETFSSHNASVTTANRTSKVNKSKTGTEKKKIYDWDSLRKKTCQDGATKERSSDTMDSLDWEAVRCADVSEISKTIRERGMNNMLSERIQAFLNRVVKDHGSIDLEWLRDVPPDSVKDYLLSIRGLGLKSVECVRLLTLHHLAFPVDTNVGRICVRLGWVPLQPLPESLQLHLLEMYPVLETIQKYIWPRLCKLDQRTLYELHYQMITFGKVFCTKSKPNCNACPMRGECKHFASAYASARFALPGPEETAIVRSTIPHPTETDQTPVYNTMCLPQLENTATSREGTGCNNCEPIVEEPASPEHESVYSHGSNDIEDVYVDDPEEIPHIKLNLEALTQNVQDFVQANNMELQDGDVSNALVALSREVASIPMPKLKNAGRLRTEHQVYELPDEHELLRGLQTRERDDPSSYLLAIWSPGETAQSTEAPTICCNPQVNGNLCDEQTCFACNSTRESQAQTVRGTLLIPCRTAMRGSFPLNGTYFQVNEVFADHDSSHNPICVSRQSIWNLPRRTVYFGTSVIAIFRGLETEGIQYCFWKGFVCVRGFDRTTGAPRPLCARLHIAASRATQNKKARAAEAAAAARKEEHAAHHANDKI